jgi:hypothetical protein
MSNKPTQPAAVTVANAEALLARFETERQRLPSARQR